MAAVINLRSERYKAAYHGKHVCSRKPVYPKYGRTATCFGPIQAASGKRMGGPRGQAYGRSSGKRMGGPRQIDMSVFDSDY